MSVTRFTRDVGDVIDKICPECEVVTTFEDMNQDWIKRDMGVID